MHKLSQDDEGGNAGSQVVEKIHATQLSAQKKILIENTEPAPDLL